MVASDQQHHPGYNIAATGRRTGSERLIDGLWLLWIATLPLGHATGLHNTLAIVVIAATLFATRAERLFKVPALAALIALLTLAAASLAWSPLPDVSAGKFRSDLLLPVLGYCAAFLWAATGGARAMLLGFAVGLGLLVAFSLVELAPLSVTASWPLLDLPDASGHRMAHWYPGVGDASSDVVLVLGPLLVWRYLAGHWRDATTSMLAFGAVLVVLVSKNRDAVILLPLGLALFALLWNSCRTRPAASLPTPPMQRPARRWALWSAAAAAGLLAVLVTIELVSQRRLAEAHVMVPFGQATLQLMSLDPRPQMWAEFVHLGSAHPWLGVGYGRTVPASVYDVLHDPVMVAGHASGFEHAHNFFLNTWLQLGLVGLLLVLVVFGLLLRRAWRQLRAAPIAALCGCGALTLIITTVLRNSLDDFLIYSMASGFWIGIGLLLGLGEASTQPEPQAGALG